MGIELKRAQQNQGMEIILSSTEFYRSLLETLDQSRTGKIKWHSREEVLGTVKSVGKKGMTKSSSAMIALT